MNKLFKGTLAAVMMASLAACAGTSSPEAGNSETAGMPENPVTIQVNTDGVGHIAVGKDGNEPEWDEEFPLSSIVEVVEKDSEMKLAAEADEDYIFVKWTKDGKDYSQDETTSIKADADAEYIAVFLMDSGYEGEPVSDINDAKVLGDILALPYYGSGFINNSYIVVFELNGKVYRVSGEMSDELADQYWAIDFDDPDRDQKQYELIKDLPITNVENLTEAIPSAEALAQYTGKLCQDLIDAGWITTGYTLEDKQITMEDGTFKYTIRFDGDIDTDQDDMDLAVKDCTVTGIEYDGIGDAVN